MVKNECFLFRKPCPNRSGACLCAEPDGDSCPLYRWFKAKVLEIEKDVVAVVRCKDCKHWTKALVQCNVFTVNGVAHCTSPDWFCADGEKVSE